MAHKTSPLALVEESATNGVDALDRTSRGLRPALIVLDLMMPVMDGWETLKWLKVQGELSAIPVVIVSAGPDRPASADCFLQKLAARNTMNMALLVSDGPVAHYLGWLAAELGDAEKAAAHSDAVALSERTGAALFAERSRRTLEALGRPVAAPARTESLPLLRQDGEIWTLSHDGRKAQLRDSKGLHYLAALLREPGRELHVSDLIGQDASGDAGEVLDARAKAAYRERLEHLADALDDAEERGDREGMARIQREREALGDELSRAVGLGGRDRKAGAAAERARINVQRRIRDVVARVAEIDEALGRHLEQHLKTGFFCSWRP